MKLFTKWWVKPIKLTDKESKVFKICQLILSNSEIDIIPEEFGYLIYSKDMVYFFRINSNSISYSNHGFVVVKDYRDEFINLVIKIISDKTQKKADTILNEMSKNEDSLLDNMINQLQLRND